MADLAVNSNFIILSSSTKVILLRKKEDTFEHIILCPENKDDVVSDKSKCGVDADSLSVSTDISESGQLFALCAGKTLCVWSLDDFQILRTWKVIRSVSKIRFTPGDKGIVLADKSGDVYFYSIENLEQPILQLLGHLSVILDVLVSCDEKFIITCDRDEKIRVSRFLNSYNIQSYCLGHKEFVSIIELLPHNNDFLLSCSGDETLRLWHFLDGTEMFCYNLRDLPTSILSKSNDSESPLVVTCITAIKGASNSYLFASLNGISGILILNVINSDKQFDVEYHSFIPTSVDPVCIKSTDNIIWVLLSEEVPLKAFIWDPHSKSLKKYEVNVDDVITGSMISFLKDIEILSKNKLKDHLYKKKYDNVQEYLEKKKARLMESVKNE